MKDNLVRDQLFSLWMLLTETQHLVCILSDIGLSKYDITRQQVLMLSVTTFLGNKATPNRIAQLTFLKRNTVSELINRMEKKGLLKKINKSEGRTRIEVRLTKRGEQAYHQALKERDLIAGLMLSLSKDERQQLKSCLEKLRVSTLKQLDPDRKFNSSSVSRIFGSV